MNERKGIGSADGRVGGPTNPANYHPGRDYRMAESCALGAPVTRRFRLAVTPQEYYAWLRSRSRRVRGIHITLDGADISVCAPDGEMVRLSLCPVAGGVEVEAVLLDVEEYDAFLELVQLSVEKFAPRAETRERVEGTDDSEGGSRNAQPSREPEGESAVATAVVATAPERGQGDPLAVIPSVADREFVRRWNAGEDTGSLARRFKLKGARAAGTKASELRKVFGSDVVNYRRNQGTWGEDDE